MALPNRKNKEGAGQGRWIAGMAILALIGAVAVIMTMKSPPAGGNTQPVASTPAPALTPITPDKSGAMPAGVIAPTQAQQNASQQVPVVDDVHMNQLALDRINADRKARGLPPLALPTVAPGHEVDTSIHSPSPATAANASNAKNP